MKVRLHWGVGAAVVYTLFTTVTVGFVIFAVANPAALVSEDYYREATEHDRRILAVANARAAGAQVARAPDVPGRPAAVVFSVAPSHHGRASGTVTWYRPSDAAADRSLTLDVDADGLQSLMTVGLAPGLWRLKVDWEVDKAPFYFEAPVMVTP